MPTLRAYPPKRFQKTILTLLVAGQGCVAIETVRVASAAAFRESSEAARSRLFVYVGSERRSSVRAALAIAAARYRVRRRWHKSLSNSRAAERSGQNDGAFWQRYNRVSMRTTLEKKNIYIKKKKRIDVQMTDELYHGIYALLIWYAVRKSHFDDARVRKWHFCLSFLKMLH